MYTFDNRTLNYRYFSKKQTRSFRTRTTYIRSPNVFDVIMIRILSHAASAVFIYKRVTEPTKCTSYITIETKTIDLSSRFSGLRINFKFLYGTRKYALDHCLLYIYIYTYYSKRIMYEQPCVPAHVTRRDSRRLAAPITTAAKRKMCFFFH